jgi:hypothetical protein
MFCLVVLQSSLVDEVVVCQAVTLLSFRSGAVLGPFFFRYGVFGFANLHGFVAHSLCQWSQPSCFAYVIYQTTHWG